MADRAATPNFHARFWPGSSEQAGRVAAHPMTAAAASLVIGVLSAVLALFPSTRLGAVPLALVGLALANRALAQSGSDLAVTCHVASAGLPINGVAATIAGVGSAT